jgi:hypothetical protein
MSHHKADVPNPPRTNGRDEAVKRSEADVPNRPPTNERDEADR